MDLLGGVDSAMPRDGLVQWARSDLVEYQWVSWWVDGVEGVRPSKNDQRLMRVSGSVKVWRCRGDM